MLIGMLPQKPALQSLEILYQDHYFVAINKPPGLLVHRSRIAAGATRFALQQLRDQIGQYLYPVHRLDRPTSGVLLFALSPEVAAETSRLFTSCRVKKSYLAIVRGYTGETGVVHHRVKRVKDPLAPGPEDRKDAITEYTRLSTLELPFFVTVSELERV